MSFPLISDFHPKGEIAQAFGVYLDEKGITDRATVIVDASGTVRYATSVTPAGVRQMEELVRFCEQIDGDWPVRLPEATPPKGLPTDVKLYIKDRCMFSRWALSARANLHLEEALPVINVSRDPEALAELQARGGKGQAPALAIGDRIMYESADIARYLAEHASWTLT